MELIKVKKGKNATITLTLSGELTVFKVAQLKKEFGECLENIDCRVLKMDLSDVVEIDTAFYQFLIQIKKYCDQKSLQFSFVSLSQAVQDVVDIFNMNNFFEGAKSHPVK